MPERRRFRRGTLDRMFTRPLPAAAIHTVVRVALRVSAVVAALCLVAGIAWFSVTAWSRRVPLVTPRHRAEALCFSLSAPPAFAPPIRIETSAALVKRQFAPGTPAGIAVRQVMRLDEPMVVAEESHRVGDYDVSALWLRLPNSRDGRHWLVVGWMEQSDLATCSFRFVDDADDLTAEAERWGRELLARILVPGNFEAGTLPVVNVRAQRNAALPSFGPKPPG